MPLRDYLSLMKSDSFSWGVTLAINTRFARTSELVDMATVRNLLALEIFTPAQRDTTDDAMDTPFPKFSDRVLKTWSELAQSSGAFAHLRCLRLFNQDSVTAQGIRYLTSFPALQTVVWRNWPRLDSQRTARNEIEGWDVISMPADSIRNDEQAPSCRSEDSLYHFYRRNHDDEQTDGPAWARDIPILDFQIGQVESNTGNGSRSPGATATILKRKPSRLPRTSVADKRKQTAIPTDAGYCKKARTRTPAMRSRQTKDLSQVLSEFL